MSARTIFLALLKKNLRLTLKIRHKCDTLGLRNVDKTFSYPHFRRVAVHIYKSYPQMGDNFVDILRITFLKSYSVCKSKSFMIAIA